MQRLVFALFLKDIELDCLLPISQVFLPLFATALTSKGGKKEWDIANVHSKYRWSRLISVTLRGQFFEDMYQWGGKVWSIERNAEVQNFGRRKGTGKIF